MARRPSLIAKKSKKPKIRSSRSENYLINRKYLGDEPVEGYTFKSNAEYTKALTWYNYQCTTDDAREYLNDYLVDLDREEEAAIIRGIADVWIPLTACWGARMITRGVEVPDTTMAFIETKIEEMLERDKEQRAAESNVEKLSPAEKLRERQSALIAEIEALIDKGEEFSLYEFLKANEIPVSYMPVIVNYYTPIVSEYVELLDFEDEQLMEAYAHMSPDEIEERGTLLNSIVEDAERYADNTKAQRAPRVMKKRASKSVPVEKKLQNLKYQKEDIGMKLSSVNPAKIIGAKELWTYNTRYKTMAVMRSDDGLDIKGTTVININEDESFCYRVARKTEEALEAVKNATKHSLKFVANNYSTASFSGRINENTIILRVVT